MSQAVPGNILELVIHVLNAKTKYGVEFQNDVNVVQF